MRHKIFNAIPDDEVDYSYSTAPYIKPKKSGAICDMVGIFLLVLAAAGADGTAELWQIATCTIVGVLTMGLGVALHE